jgi:hypothetical protein
MTLRESTKPISVDPGQMSGGIQEERHLLSLADEYCHGGIGWSSVIPSTLDRKT